MSGQDRAVDVVEFGGDGLESSCFMVMAGLGLDAAIMQGAPAELKARMGWPAYVVSALRQLRYPACDGRDQRRRRAVDASPGAHRGDRQRGLPAGRDPAAA
jgi:hypothetical protein